LLILIISSACLSLLIIARKPFLEIASYDYVWPLASYVFCFVNLNWLEYYWIAKRRTDLVLYYSAGRLAVRVTVLLIVAYLTRNVKTILWSLVGVEALRLSLVAVYLLRANLLTTHIEPTRIREQLRFASPAGLAGLTQQVSQSIGALFIGSIIGPAALALYAVASYMMRPVRIVVHSISAVVFPELVRARDNPDGALRLWQRTNVVLCVLLFPPFILLTYYAEIFVTTLFTDKYVAAVPLFQIYALWFLRRCFNTDVLLRTRGKTGFMLTGSILSLIINFALMNFLYRWLGLIGPAVAFIASEFLLEAYYTTLIKKKLGVSLVKLVDWKGVRRVGVGCVVGIPVLVAGDYIPGPDVARVVLASLVFVAVCWTVAYRLGVTDIGRLVAFGLSTVASIGKRSDVRNT